MRAHGTQARSSLSIPSYHVRNPLPPSLGMSVTPVPLLPSSPRPRQTLRHGSTLILTGVSPCTFLAMVTLSSCAITPAPEAPDGTKWYVRTLFSVLVLSDPRPGSGTCRYVPKRPLSQWLRTHLLRLAPGRPYLRARAIQRRARSSRRRPLITHHVFVTSKLLCCLLELRALLRYSVVFASPRVLRARMLSSVLKSVQKGTLLQLRVISESWLTVVGYRTRTSMANTVTLGDGPHEVPQFVRDKLLATDG